MPFSKTQSCTEQKWTEIFEYIIKPAVEEGGLGYECERSVAERQNIIKGILESLKKIKLHLEVHGTGKAYYAWKEDNDICVDIQPYKGPTKTYHCGREFIKPSEPSDFK